MKLLIWSKSENCTNRNEADGVRTVEIPANVHIPGTRLAREIDAGNYPAWLENTDRLATYHGVTVVYDSGYNRTVRARR